ncbi:helix-turn-helix domain-containing protein [Paenibacillus cymbidii]|uniref:helix-turn-helix domain-containing protein n=1 Tax=Paenibacillus cymbidii TaxID=1639034 RepID=UPI0010804250|nr:AraC family transcriptional regulator [Paenibacillus cymbidii]
MTTAHGPQDDPVQEEIVVYQNPLLFLKVWEVRYRATDGGARDYWPWHYHKEVEFLVVTEGRLVVQTKDERFELQPGDVALFGSSQLHRVRHAAPGTLAFLVLQIDLLQHFDPGSLPYLHGFAEPTRPLAELNYIWREQPDVRREAAALIAELYRESQDRQRGYELAVAAAVKRLLWLLVRHDSRRLLQAAEADDVRRLRPALDYIETRLHERIAVDDVCRLMNFSYHYFIRFFRATMGMSLLEFVNYNRIRKAERLLLTRDLSIAEVAAQVGIPSMAQFYKLFGRFNDCSPKAFKQRMGAGAGTVIRSGSGADQPSRPHPPGPNQEA